MSDVCLPPVHDQVSGIHHHHHHVGCHIQILLRVVRPSHEKEEKKEKADE